MKVICGVKQEFELKWAAMWREEKGTQMLGQINPIPESSLEMVLPDRIKCQLHLSKALMA